MKTGFRTSTSGMVIGEKFKGFFVSGGVAKRRRKLYPGELGWVARCKYYDRAVEQNPLAKQGLMSIAGKVVQQGIFTEVAYEDGSHATRAQEAKDKCDELNKQLGLNVMLYDTVFTQMKYGGCFWEKTWEPRFDTRIIPMQEAIEPAEVNDIGEVTVWRQNIFGAKNQPTWSRDDIVHFAWNVSTKSWPYGTSHLIGLDTEFDSLQKIETAVSDFAEKQGLPKELWQVGDGQFMPTDTEVEAIRAKVKNWSAGEEFVTSYPINRIAGGTGEHPLSEISKILDFYYTHIVDGMMIAPISKQWSSTMASAEEMEIVQRAHLITPLQRLISMKIQREIYWPYLESLGYSVKICPKVSWEAPDAHKDEEAEYWALQVGAGIVPAEYAALEQGFDMDKIKKFKEEQMRKEAEQMQYAKQDFGVNPKQGIKQKINPEEKE